MNADLFKSSSVNPTSNDNISIRAQRSLKPGSHITVMVPAVPAVVVPGRVRLRHLLLVPATAGRVQSCLRYHRYRTVREKESHESLLKWSSS